MQEFYMKEISSMDFTQHGEVFYFYGQALRRNMENGISNRIYNYFDYATLYQWNNFEFKYL
jgi:hypothetical protein